MSGWTGTAQAFLDAGGQGIYESAVWINARLRGGALATPFGFWTGHNEEQILVDGELRTYIAAGASLLLETPRYSAGTELRTTSCTLSGLSEEAQALYRTYDLTQCRVETHRLIEGPGGTILGTWRDIVGVVETSDLQIPPDGGEATVTLAIAGFAWAGTRVISAKKSHESYLRRDGDTSMKWASVKDEEDDEWITT